MCDVYGPPFNVATETNTISKQVRNIKLFALWAIINAFVETPVTDKFRVEIREEHTECCEKDKKKKCVDKDVDQQVMLEKFVSVYHRILEGLESGKQDAEVGFELLASIACGAMIPYVSRYIYDAVIHRWQDRVVLDLGESAFKRVVTDSLRSLKQPINLRSKSTADLTVLFVGLLTTIEILTGLKKGESRQAVMVLQMWREAHLHRRLLNGEQSLLFCAILYSLWAWRNSLIREDGEVAEDGKEDGPVFGDRTVLDKLYSKATKEEKTAFQNAVQALFVVGKCSASIAAIIKLVELVKVIAERWNKEVQENDCKLFIDAKLLLERAVLEQVPSPIIMRELIETKSRIEDHMKLVRSVPNNYARIASDIDQMVVNYKAKMVAATGQIQPLCIFLAGKTGLGKTTLARMMAQAAHEHMRPDVEWNNNLFYDWQPSQKFYNGAPGCHWLLDDQTKFTSKEDAVAFVVEWLNVVSYKRHNLNMADVSLKGNMYSNVATMVVVSNDFGFQLGETVSTQTIDAVHRRVNLWIKQISYDRVRIYSSFDDVVSGTCFEMSVGDCLSFINAYAKEHATSEANAHGMNSTKVSWKDYGKIVENSIKPKEVYEDDRFKELVSIYSKGKHYPRETFRDRVAAFSTIAKRLRRGAVPPPETDEDCGNTDTEAIQTETAEMEQIEEEVRLTEEELKKEKARVMKILKSYNEVPKQKPKAQFYEWSDDEVEENAVDEKKPTLLDVIDEEDVENYIRGKSTKHHPVVEGLWDSLTSFAALKDAPEARTSTKRARSKIVQALENFVRASKTGKVDETKVPDYIMMIYDKLDAASKQYKTIVTRKTREEILNQIRNFTPDERNLFCAGWEAADDCGRFYHDFWYLFKPHAWKCGYRTHRATFLNVDYNKTPTTSLVPIIAIATSALLVLGYVATLTIFSKNEEEESNSEKMGKPNRVAVHNKLSHKVVSREGRGDKQEGEVGEYVEPHKIKANLCKITAHLKGVNRTQFCVMLGKRRLLLTKHFYVSLLQHEVTVTVETTHATVQLANDEFKNLPCNVYCVDLLVLELPAYTPLFKSITPLVSTTLPILSVEHKAVYVNVAKSTRCIATGFDDGHVYNSNKGVIRIESYFDVKAPKETFGGGFCGSLLTIDGKVVGYHVSGNGDNQGTAIPLDAKLVEQMLNDELDFYSDVQMPKAHVVLRESIPVECEPYVLETDCKPSSISEPVSRLLSMKTKPSLHLETQGKEPAAIGWFLTGQTTKDGVPIVGHHGIDGMLKWLDRTRIAHEVDARMSVDDKKLFIEIAALVGADLASHLETYEYRPLTLHEVVAGGFGLPAMDLKKAAGFCSAKQYPKKADYFKLVDGKYVFKDQIVNDAFNACVNSLESGLGFTGWDVMDYTYKASQKEEKKGLKEVDGMLVVKPTRLFAASPLFLTMVLRMYLWPLLVVVTNKPIETELGVGMNPVQDFGRLEKKFRDCDLVGMDYKNYDQTIPIQVMRAVNFAILTFMSRLTSTHKHNQAILNICKVENNSVAYLGMRFLTTGLTSGMVGTSIKGGIANKVLHTFCIAKLKQLSADDAFSLFKQTSFICYGDDFVMRAVDGCDLDKVVKILNNLNMEPTNPNKTGKPTLLKLDEMDFLSRSFGIEDDWVYARLKKESIESLLDARWEGTTQQEHVQNVSSTLFYELAMWDKDYFDTIKSRFITIALTLGVDVSRLSKASLSQEELRSRIRDGEYNPADVVVENAESGVEKAIENVVGAAVSATADTAHDLVESTIGTVVTPVTGIIKSVVNKFAKIASPILSLFGLDHPSQIVNRSPLDDAYGGVFNADGISRAMSLGLTQTNSVAKRSDVMIETSISQLGAIFFPIGVFEIGSTVSSKVVDDLILSALPLVPFTIASNEMILPPWGPAVALFKYWRCKAIQVRVTAIKAPTTQMQLICVATHNAATTLDYVDVNNYSVASELVSFDTSKSNTVIMEIPWTWTKPYKLVCPWKSDQLFQDNEDAAMRTALGSFGVQVFKPPVTAKGEAATASCMIEMRIIGLEVMQRSNEFISTVMQIAEAGDRVAMTEVKNREGKWVRVEAHYRTPARVTSSQNQATITTSNSTVVPSVLNDGMLNLFVEGDNLGNPKVIERDVLISTEIPWNAVGVLPNSTLNLPEAIVSNSLVKSQLNYAQQLQTDYVVTVTLNSALNTRGLLYLFAVPLGKMYSTAALTKMTSKVSQMAYFNHVPLIAGGKTSAELRLPYLGLQTAHLLQGTIDEEDLQRQTNGWTVGVFAVTAFTDESGTPLTTKLSMTARFDGPHCRVPVPFLAESGDVPITTMDETQTSSSAKLEIVKAGKLKATNVMAHELVGGEYVDSVVSLLHAGQTKIFAPSISTETTATTKAYYMIDSVEIPFSENAFGLGEMKVWRWLRSMYAIHRGSLNIVFGMVGSFGINTIGLDEMYLAMFAYLQNVNVNRITNTSQFLDASTASDLIKIVQLHEDIDAGGAITNAKLSSTIAVRVPFFSPNFFQFIRPNWLQDVDSTLAPIEQTTAVVGILTTGAPKATTADYVRPHKMITISAADDYSMACIRPLCFTRIYTVSPPTGYVTLADYQIQFATGDYSPNI